MAARKRLVLCMDGTWNNPYREKERDDGTRVLKPSNPLKLCRAVLPFDERDGGTVQVTHYDAGVGALGKYPGFTNSLLRFVDATLGGAWGAGFEANIEQAVTFLSNNYLPADPVFVFGFSRGAAQAQALTRFIDWMGGVPRRGDAYFVPLLFQAYITSEGKGLASSVTTSSGGTAEILPLEVTFLGLFDTVMSLGSRLRARDAKTRTERSFHVGSRPANCVVHARQALAIDERRYDFLPEVWLEGAPGRSLEQRWFAGVHSNVGGGYLEDGLANVPLQWLADEAADAGLALDRKFLGEFDAYAYGRQYSSQSLLYRVLDRLRGRDGSRRLVGYPPATQLSVDYHVIHRLAHKPTKGDKHQMTKLYRPANLLEYLAQQPDLDAYLASLERGPTPLSLPPAVRSELDKLRRQAAGTN